MPTGCFAVTGTQTYTCPDIGNARVLALGGTNFTQDDHQYQTLFKDNVTITAAAHTIKFGAKVNFTKLQRLEDNNGSGTYFFDAANFTGLGSSTPYAATINTAAVRPVTAKNTEVGLFVQDDWRPDDHWLVSYGLRWDYEFNARNENFITPPDVASAIRAYPGWAAAGINPNDYISTGHNRKHFYGAFQPRLGVSYDLHGDRDLVFLSEARGAITIDRCSSIPLWKRSRTITIWSRPSSVLREVRAHCRATPTLFALLARPRAAKCTC